MSTMVRDAWGGVKAAIEDAAQDESLSADARLAKLRLFRDDLNDLLGRADTYIGDLELVREGRDPLYREQVMEMREGASLRAVLLDRGMASDEDLDALGLLSHDDLDKLDEEGLLEAWIQEGLGGVIGAAWEEMKHPRGGHGRFRDVLGRSVKPKGRKGGKVPMPSAPHVPPRPDAAKPVSEKPRAPHHKIEADEGGEVHHVGGDIALAAQLLGEGKRVRLSQPREVATLLDKLSEIVDDARKKGKDAPHYDLCLVSVKGTNLFCQQSKGVARVKMPQFKGQPLPGSMADKLPKDSKGRVDLSELFRAHLDEQGVKITPGTEQASHLRASQSELNGAQVARMAARPRQSDEAVFVSRDNYIVDGHHRWAATVGAASKTGGDPRMKVETVDMDIGALLDEANRFTREWGIAAQSANLDAKLKQARAEGLNAAIPEKGETAQRLLGEARDTRELHTVAVRGSTPGTRVYTPERQALHDSIIDMLLRKRQEVANARGEMELHPDASGEYLKPGDAPRALFMAGGPASGKTTALAMPENHDVLPDDAVHIDPDEIKSLLPEYVEMVTAKDRYSGMGAHEESSDIAKRLQQEAMQRGLNVVVDGAGNSGQGKYAGKLSEMKEAGYDVEVLYVNASLDVALARAVARAERTGRWMPESEIRKYHKGVSERFPEVRALVADGTISRMKMYDTSTETPVLMADAQADAFSIRDKDTYGAFLAKIHE